MPIEHPDTRKLLFGALFVGASALPAGAVFSGLLAGVGGNWLAEAFGGVVASGPPPGEALARAFARAVQTASTELRKEYGVERARHDGADAFELLRQTARSVTAVETPAGVADLAAVRSSLSGALGQVLLGFPDPQVHLLRDRLLPAWTADDTWGRYFWDWPNPTQNCSTTADAAGYLISHPQLFPNWRSDARNILTLFLNR
ncbi:MAG: hypothetical protein WCI67_22020, partial [Chloroflexales bacterium]